jgi:Zn-finger nucleic acid-binding protein
MTDAYRTAGYVCPTCPESAPLREFGTRLVCDACDGIQLSLEDFARQVPHVEVRVIDDGRAALPCPRCGLQMRGCFLAAGKRQLEQPLVRCERDGIWFGDGALQVMYEEIGSGGNVGGRGGAGRGDGGFGHLYGGAAGRRPLPRASRKPAEHAAAPPSALQGHRLTCPNRDCHGRTLFLESGRWRCDRCEGAFIEDAVLAAFVAEMVSEPWTVPPPAGQPGERRCPACASALTVEQLEGATVDRCAEHGVWFDPTELEAALQHAAGVDPQAPHAASVSWWRRLVEALRSGRSGGPGGLGGPA